MHHTPERINAGIKRRPRTRMVSLLKHVCLIAGLLGGTGTDYAAESAKRQIDAVPQEKVAHLLQQVIQEYWHGGDGTVNRKTNEAWNSAKLETVFRQASAVEPERLDLRFGIASALIVQALETNGAQLKVKVREALETYQTIQRLSPNSLDAPLLYAAYGRAVEETNAYAAGMESLRAMDPKRAREYEQKFQRIDALFQLTPNLRATRVMSDSVHHAIIVLGAGLETNGTVKAKLVDRLQQGLKLATMYPSAPIILTGGNPHAGVTEAYAMSRWYSERGISPKRLWLEDRARDTVENALFSSAMLERLDIREVTLVTSASHIRRGLADLQEACRDRGLAVSFDLLASQTKGDSPAKPDQERLALYRDVLRTSGIWCFPGLQR